MGAGASTSQMAIYASFREETERNTMLNKDIGTEPAEVEEEFEIDGDDQPSKLRQAIVLPSGLVVPCQIKAAKVRFQERVDYQPRERG
mmetsp:Transcript_33667/g.89178  ORF Transcript_33667/g.89178 Transcript_33667/m.89178 type:complete len:88 (+) Transcript_33667:82-345(+)